MLIYDFHLAGEMTQTQSEKNEDKRKEENSMCMYNLGVQLIFVLQNFSCYCYYQIWLFVTS